MANGYNRDKVCRRVSSMAAFRTAPPARLRDLFDAAYRLLAAHYRNEYVFKSAIAHAAIPAPIGGGQASVQIELPVFRSILDVATASSTTVAYEIKTEFDSSRRLETQSRDYLRVFDLVYVVATERSLTTLSRNLDERVGLIALEENGTMHAVRQAESNRHNLEPRQICWGLRKAERVGALERRLGLTIKVPGGLLGEYCENLFSDIPSLELHEIYLEAMRKRSDPVLKDGFLHALPVSLRALGYATPLSGIGRKRVLEALDMEVPFALHALAA
jgi:hypothetical protein